MNDNGNRGEADGIASDAALSVEAGDEFVLTPRVQQIVDRALVYLQTGYPVHFSGPAGTGKTTLALHLAALRGRAVMLIHGDDEFGSSDLIGGDYGYQKNKLIDNYIHSVLKTQENVNTLWADNRLTLACKSGDTLIYDEFTRSRPEANNVLLSALEEGLLTLPKCRPHSGGGYLEVHPDFRAIFTSNPEEYAGVHRTQDALMDRLITIKLDYFDRYTEVKITQKKSGIPEKDAEVIVDIVRELRGLGLSKHGPSLRACIMIARLTAQQDARAHSDDPAFLQVCRDVLDGHSVKVVRGGESNLDEKIAELINKRAVRHTPRVSVPRPVTQRANLAVSKGA